MCKLWLLKGLTVQFIHHNVNKVLQTFIHHSFNGSHCSSSNKIKKKMNFPEENNYNKLYWFKMIYLCVCVCVCVWVVDWVSNRGIKLTEYNYYYNMKVLVLKTTIIIIKKWWFN